MLVTSYFCLCFYLPAHPAQVGRTFYATCRCCRSWFAWLLWGITSHYWKYPCGYQSLNKSFAFVCVCVLDILLYMPMPLNIILNNSFQKKVWCLVVGFWFVISLLWPSSIPLLFLILDFSPINMLISYARSLKNPWTLVL